MYSLPFRFCVFILSVFCALQMAFAADENFINTVQKTLQTKNEELDHVKQTETSPAKADDSPDSENSNAPEKVQKLSEKSAELEEETDEVKRSSSYRIKGVKYETLLDSHSFKEIGKASWYGRQFHGRRTASGEIFNMNHMTAAHRILPLGTMILVKNIENGKVVKVKVNDRGPFHDERVLDLSYAAAKAVGVDKAGIALVEITAL